MTSDQAPTHPNSPRWADVAHYLWGNSIAWRVRVGGIVLGAVAVVVMIASYGLLALGLKSREPLLIDEELLGASRVLAHVAGALMTALLVGWVVSWVVRYRRGDGDLVSRELDRLSPSEQWALRVWVLVTVVIAVISVLGIAGDRYIAALLAMAASVGAGLCFVICDHVRYEREQKAGADDHG